MHMPDRPRASHVTRQLPPHVHETSSSRRGSFVTCSVVALVGYLILGAWTLPEVLHIVKHVSQCFIICRPQNVAGGRAFSRDLAAAGASLDVEHLVVERL